MSKQLIIKDDAPMTLCDEPKAALKEIAGYLRCVSTKGREIKDGDGELLGYWQTPEYLQGCLDIAAECERIVELESTEA